MNSQAKTANVPTCIYKFEVFTVLESVRSCNPRHTFLQLNSVSG